MSVSSVGLKEFSVLVFSLLYFVLLIIRVVSCPGSGQKIKTLQKFIYTDIICFFFH